MIGADFKLFEKVAEISGRPVIWNALVFANDQHGNTFGYWKDIIGWLEGCNARGLRIFGHALSCRADTQFSLDDWSLYDSIPAWRDISMGTIPERMKKMRDPALRQSLRD